MTVAIPTPRHALILLVASSALAASPSLLPAQAQSLAGVRVDADGISTDASASLANRQTGAGDLTGTADPQPALYDAGDLAGAGITITGNTVAAGATANLADNRLQFADGATRAGGGMVAGVTSLQELSAQKLLATVPAGAAYNVDGDLHDSNLAIADCRFETVATGNLASANTLTVDTSDLMGSPMGRVRVSADGSIGAAATLSLVNVQDGGTASIAARQDSGAVELMLYGQTDQSSISARDNSQMGTAIANSASNLLDPGISQISGSAVLGNVQSGNSQVSVAVGSREAGRAAGVTIAPQAVLAGTRVSVADNDLAATAMGNFADSRIAAADATVPGSGIAMAGSPGSDHGALGALALVNSQKLGAPGMDGTPIASISSAIASRFGVDGDFAAPGSTVAVTGNSQKAVAVANTAQSAIDANSNAGTALASDQYGQASVVASSDMKLAGKATGDGVITTISGNANAALAVMNDAANRVTDNASGNDTVALASAVGFAPPVATGQVALANQQLATGSVTAAATSRAFPSDTGGSAASARFVVTDNIAEAEASANRANNMATAGSGAALANSQVNRARVSANAAMSGAAGFDSIDDRSGLLFDGNSAQSLARGNAAVNAMTIDSDGVTSAPGAATPALNGATATAMSALVNNQMNEAAITAAGSAQIPLNLGVVDGAAIAGRDNSLAVSAMGNIAHNSITSPLPAGAAIASSQTNTAPVSATATGSILAATRWSGGTLALSGNQVTATAIGNQVVNAVTIGH